MVSWRTFVDRFQSLPRRARIGMAAGAVLVLGAGSVLVAAPTLVRSVARERAAERGFALSIERVGLGFDKVRLSGVTVEDTKLPGSRAELDQIEVGLGIFSERRVAVRGGRVRLLGGEAALRERLESLRGTPRARETPSSAAPRRLRVFAQGIDVAWREQPALGRTLNGWGIRVERGESGAIRLAWDLVRVEGAEGGADLRAGEATFDDAKRVLERVELAEVRLRAEISSRAAAEDPKPVTVAQAVPPAPPRSLPALVRALGPSLSRGLSERFEAKVVALRAEVRHADEQIRIGPSSVDVKREGAALRTSIVPHPSAAVLGTPLTIHARVPLDATPLELELGGGPVSLTTLGVEPGNFGLVAPEQARLQAELKLVITEAGELDVTSRGRIEGVRLLRPAISSSELSGIEFGWRGAGSAKLDGSKLVVRDAELSIGDVRAEVSGELERAEHTRFNLKAALPAVACSSLREALPDGIAPLLTGVKLDGTFAMSLAVEYDGKKASATRTKLELSNRCRIKEYPGSIAPRRFRSTWLREVKGEDGRAMPIESGPGSADWTPYEDISPHLETAVTVSEDGGFFRHKGFDSRALESAVKDNLIAGRYLRGASTISMQLAKNLYLGSEKTISRKIQEAVLVVLLEQELSKHEMMELYLNVIEFGPGIYGVKRAAQHYFNESPRELSLGQALYLSSILPNPDSSHFRADGSLSERWAAYLRKLMQIAHDRGKISDEELEAGLAEEVRFGTPSGQTTPPRPSELGDAGSADIGDDPPPELRAARARDRGASVGAQ